MKDLRTFFPTVCSEELISIDSSLSKGSALKIIIFQNVLQSLTESQS